MTLPEKMGIDFTFVLWYDTKKLPKIKKMIMKKIFSNAG